MVSTRIVLAKVLLSIVFLAVSCGEESTFEPPPSSKLKLGISILPKGDLSQWDDATFTEAFQKAKEGGFSVSIWRHQWGQIEPVLGSYQWGDLDYEFFKTEEQAMQYSLVLEVIHTNSLGLYPEGISFSAFNDSTFMRNLTRFVADLLNRYGGQLHYFWLGNEVDFYLHENPDQTEPFLELYRRVKNEIKTLDPDVTVGIVGAYHLARSNGEIPMLQTFSDETDAIGLTLYMEDDDQSPGVSQTQSYFAELVNNFSDKKVAIIETSWSSDGPRGGLEEQKEYVQELAQVLETYQDSFLFFSWFILYDLPEDLNREVAVSFGICPEEPPDPPPCEEFLLWQGSLAMLRNDGSEKPAWQAWVETIGH